MQNGPILPKQKRQQPLSIYITKCIHPKTLRNKKLTKSTVSAANCLKQVRQFPITAKQRVKITVHLENGTYRKLMHYHQDPDFFLRNRSTVTIIFIYFKKECFRIMKVHFPCLTILILFFFEMVFEIQFSFPSFHNFGPR